MNVQLSKDADALMCLLYKRYCESRKDGKSICNSSYFDDDETIHKDIAPKWLLSDITHLCWVLHEAELLYVRPGDNKANDIMITDAGLSYMQHRFPKGLSQVLAFLSKLSSAVTPWL
jgi:hypothetical protein